MNEQDGWMDETKKEKTMSWTMQWVWDGLFCSLKKQEEQYKHTNEIMGDAAKESKGVMDPWSSRYARPIHVKAHFAITCTLERCVPQLLQVLSELTTVLRKHTH